MAAEKAVSGAPFRDSGTPGVGAGDLRCAALLHGKSSLEIDSFPKRFRIRRRIVDRDELNVKALLGLRGLVRTSPCTSAGRVYQNIDAFAPVNEWTSLRTEGVSGNPSEASTRAI